MVILLVALAALVGAALAWAVATDRAHRAAGAARHAADQQIAGLTGEVLRLTSDIAGLAAELDAEHRRAADSQLLVAEATDAFAAASREALDRNTASFLDLAHTRLAQAQAEAQGELDQRRIAVETLVSPLRDALTRVEAEMAGIEHSRREAYAGLSAQVRGLTETNERLRTETAHLAGALRSPQARGRWGEVQLRRVVELAGMIPHCDFLEQATVQRAGVVRRPDLIVNLPGGHRLAIDAKVPLAAYLQAHETDDDDRRSMHLREHARALRGHVVALSDKEYWAQFSDSPDFVVLFIPGEPFLAAAYEHEPELFEYAHGRRVLLATPTTLIALLQSVAVGWRQEAMADNARAVCEVGRELYKRLSTMTDHVTSVGKALDRAVDAYNRQLGSLETRVLPSARKLAGLGIDDGEIPALEPLERAVRPPQSQELTRLSTLGDEVA